MSDKSDPLGQSAPTRSANTMWIDGESMLKARDAFFNAYMAQFEENPIQWRKWSTVPSPGHAEGDHELTVTQVHMDRDEARVHWDIACAAAMAMITYINEGRMAP